LVLGPVSLIVVGDHGFDILKSLKAVLQRLRQVLIIATQLASAQFDFVVVVTVMRYNLYDDKVGDQIFPVGGGKVLASVQLVLRADEVGLGLLV
jgi:hypothetical protein